MRLVVRGLTVRWRSGATAGPLDLDVGPGITWLRGPNGSGKTTLLRAIAASLPRDAGSVALDGVDPEQDASARARIGWVSARPVLPGFLTVQEAWRMQAALRGRPDWDGGSACDALDLPSALRLDQASTGTRRKAELVAGIAGDPDVVLLDETLAVLDDRTARTVCAWLESWRPTRIVVVVHHGELPIAADRAIHLGER